MARMVSNEQSLFERTLYSGGEMIHGGKIQPILLKDGVTFCYVTYEAGRRVAYKVDPRLNKKIPLFDVDRLLAALNGALGHDLPPGDLPFGEFGFIDEDQSVVFALEDQIFTLHLDDYQLSKEPTPPAPPEEELSKATPQSFPWILGENIMEEASPDGRWFLGLQDHNVYIRPIGGGQRIMLTSDGREELAWDTFGAKWSLDSSMVALKLIDLHAMTPIPIVHWLKPLEDVETMRWARPGQPIWKNDLYVLKIPGGERIKISLGDSTAPYLNIVGWLPTELIFALMDREYKSLQLMAADIQTGRVRTILVERQPNFHNYDVIGALPVTPLSDGQHFLWLSERDGFNHIYLYDIDGTLINQLTRGEFSVFNITAVDEGNGWIYFLAMGVDHPYDIRLYRVRFDGCEFTCLTDISGSREIIFGPTKEFFLDIHSDINRPMRTDMRKVDGTFLQTLETSDISQLISELHYTFPEEFWSIALDGETPLRGVLYKPFDFDPEKKYPVIEYIYGGPHTFDVPVSCFGFPLLEALAQAGFIVFVVDCRGTIGRGKKFQDVCYRRVGLFELEEHISVLHQLAHDRSYMDLSRVGIFGLSHGGFMTLRAMFSQPDVYHVGVATCPPYGLEDMAWLYTERFSNLPENNMENYKATSCVALAGNLKGKLLISHGSIDHNAPIAGTIKLIDALVKAGKPFDFQLLPEQVHLYTGESQKYWELSLMEYFVEHLQFRRERI
jgi:dipeptidyl-peptidase-4